MFGMALDAEAHGRRYLGSLTQDAFGVLDLARP